MKKRSLKQSPADVEIIAKAERILNRTLAYQAAIAIHELKDALGLDVEELSLAVGPLSIDAPGTYRVVCTIKSLVAADPVVLEVIVEPEKAVIPNGKKARRGGAKGGSARAAKLTKERLSESARNAVQARWHKPDSPKKP